MTDDEFADAIKEKEFSEDFSVEFKELVEDKKEELSRDYDLSDLKSNDLLMLDSLARSMVALDSFEQTAYNERKDISYENIGKIDKLQKIVSDLIADISRQQTDLKMSRKTRKGDDREDVIQKVASLTEKANQFYKQKMAYVICPECDMLLATIWVQYTDADNELTFTCGRRKGGREPEVLCKHRFTVTTKELWAQKAVTNKPEVLPEAIT
jgi:hypothetical protein